MTKHIRVENADNSNHQVDITIIENGETVHTLRLDHPTQMESLTIWKGRKIVIEEVERG